MHITLSMATSLDGFITDSGGSTSWTKDGSEWERLSKEFGALIVGRTTYEEVKNELVNGVVYLVLTSEPFISDAQTIYCTSVEEIVSKAESLGLTKLLLSGGGETNFAFAKAGLIDDMFVGIHPVFLKDGKKMFGKGGVELQVETVDVRELKEGVLQIRYKVIK